MVGDGADHDDIRRLYDRIDGPEGLTTRIGRVERDFDVHSAECTLRYKALQEQSETAVAKISDVSKSMTALAKVIGLGFMVLLVIQLFEPRVVGRLLANYLGVSP